jgi:uroporphyrinogen-III synthase
MGILITRPEDDSQKISQTLEEHGLKTYIFPLFKIILMPLVSILAPENYHALIFTSSHGVRACTEQKTPDESFLSCFKNTPLFCVGKHTAETAHVMGFENIISVTSTAADMIGKISSLPHIHKFQRFLYIRGEHIAIDIRNGLQNDGMTVDERIVYTTQSPDKFPETIRRYILNGSITTVLLYSKRTGEIFTQLAKHDNLPLENIQAIIISNNAAQSVRHAGFKTIAIAKYPDSISMFRLTLHLTRKI